MEVADVLLEIKEKEPDLTVPLVIKKAKERGNVPDNIRLPESTVYKLPARNGLTSKKSPAKDHRRFAYQYAGDLFMCDVMHGPAVKNKAGRKRKTYLIAFIDDATRVIPYAAFAHSENTAAFMEVFKQAVLPRAWVFGPNSRPLVRPPARRLAKRVDFRVCLHYCSTFFHALDAKNLVGTVICELFQY